MNNLILLWKIVNYNILYSFEQFMYEKPQIMFFISWVLSYSFYEQLLWVTKTLLV